MKQLGIVQLSGKRVWVIGASSGIGEACAKALLLHGAKVALSSRRTERLNQITLNGELNQSLMIPLDVTDNQQLQDGYKNIYSVWGGIDLLLFVSSVYKPLRADNFDIKIAEQTIDANLLGPMRAVALVIPDMLKTHSRHIAIVGSVAGYSGLPKALAYGSSKAAIINFCENLYYDLLPTGVKRAYDLARLC